MRKTLDEQTGGPINLQFDEKDHFSIYIIPTASRIYSEAIIDRIKLLSNWKTTFHSILFLLHHEYNWYNKIKPLNKLFSYFSPTMVIYFR